MYISLNVALDLKNKERDLNEFPFNTAVVICQRSLLPVMEVHYVLCSGSQQPVYSAQKIPLY